MWRFVISLTSSQNLYIEGSAWDEPCIDLGFKYLVSITSRGDILPKNMCVCSLLYLGMLLQALRSSIATLLL